MTQTMVKYIIRQHVVNTKERFTVNAPFIRVVHVGLDGIDIPCFWAIVGIGPDNPYEFLMVQDGEEVPGDMDYLGGVHNHQHRWHLFYKPVQKRLEHVENHPIGFVPGCPACDAARKTFNEARGTYKFSGDDWFDNLETIKL